MDPVLFSENAVRPTSDAIQEVLDRSSLTWSACATAATGNPLLPKCCFDLNLVPSRTPKFPSRYPDPEQPNAHLKCYEVKLGSGREQLWISGVSKWDMKGCGRLDLKDVHQRLLLGVQTPTTCLFADSSRLAQWPGIQGIEAPANGNHIAVLAFGWAYILSSKWYDLHCCRDPDAGARTSGLEYSDKIAKSACEGDQDKSDVLIELGSASDEASRWWAAVLAPGQGWQATTIYNGKTYHSPWSVSLDSPVKFAISRPINRKKKYTAPPWRLALTFLIDFCVLHNILGESVAALSAALLFPSIGGSKQATLPPPCPSARNLKSQSANTTSASDPRSQERKKLVKTTLEEHGELLPYYMTLSCNPFGMKALLCSGFFDRSVECNLVSAWIQPMFEIIDPVASEQSFQGLLAILSYRYPKLAPLWVGAIAVGYEKAILAMARYGALPIDLNAAFWTATSHSFIVGETNHPVLVDGRVLRSDECRILFYSEPHHHSRTPICAWSPFGTTALEDTDIEVRLHVSCDHHQMLYQSWYWTLEAGQSSGDEGMNPKAPTIYPNDFNQRLASISISTDRLLSSEASEVCTRSIFNWLRSDGFAKHERTLRQHSWFDLEDSDIDDSSSGETSKSQADCDRNERPNHRIRQWLDQLPSSFS